MARAYCHLRGGIPLIALLALWAAAPSAQRGEAGSAAVIIRCGVSCDEEVAAIRTAGGHVTSTYENIRAIAASVPTERLADLAAVSGAGNVARDQIVTLPRDADPIGPSGEARFAVTSLGEFEPHALPNDGLAGADGLSLSGYNLNNVMTGAAALHASDNRGQGVVVAVIDSGSANTVTAPALSGSIIGGESLVIGDPVASATSRSNDPHGTRVASMIAGHGNFVFRNTSTFIQALRAHAPATVIPCQSATAPVVCPATSSIVPMVGTAPGAKIYAVKVADSRGGGVPESRLIAAMDRVITLRRNFNAGIPSVPVAGTGTEDNPFVYNSLKIEVVNMSIGGPTLFAGHTVGEQLTLQMLDAGIVVVATAGNNGPAAMTLGNPGTGRGALAVGAMSSYLHERVLRDVQFGPGMGLLLRPSPFNQTASFSSRGPTADGRVSPDLVANGMGSFAPAAGSLDLVSGTSYAAPTVAGAAALLRKHAPWASALQIRNALIESANPAAIGDGSTNMDRGRGFLDIQGAIALLNNSAAAEELARGLREDRVLENVKSLGLEPVRFTGGTFATRLTGLLPGQVTHFFVPNDFDTGSVRIHVTDIVAEDPGNENAIFGDDLFVQVVDAPTSLARKHVDEFIDADRQFVVQRPQPGLMRVAIAGAFSNGGPVSATLTIEQHRARRSGKKTASGQVRQGQLVPVRVRVPAGTEVLALDLSWKSDWSRYPTADLDLVLVDPIGGSTSVATLDSPERVVVTTPVPGVWTIYVQGFAILSYGYCHDADGCDEEGEREGFELRVLADGRQLDELDSDEY